MDRDVLHSRWSVKTRPKSFTAESAPPEVLGLAALIVPRLLAGDDPTMVALRKQYERALIRRVELTGTGFFVDYDVPVDVPRALPVDFAGGDVKLQVAGVRVPDGCRLFVRNGRLATLEATTVAGGRLAAPRGSRWVAAAKLRYQAWRVACRPPGAHDRKRSTRRRSVVLS
jgi:hypothetical protein